jgi:hypothetical protein
MWVVNRESEADLGRLPILYGKRWFKSISRLFKDPWMSGKGVSNKGVALGSIMVGKWGTTSLDY